MHFKILKLGIKTLLKIQNHVKFRHIEKFYTTNDMSCKLK